MGLAALGMALTTSRLAVVDGVLFKPLPYRDPERLFAVSAGFSKLPSDNRPMRWTVSPLELNAWRAALPGVQFTAFSTSLYETDTLDTVLIPYVDAGFFDALGVALRGGRFAPGDFHTRASVSPVVITHALWQSRFALEPSAIGRTLVDRTARPSASWRFCRPASFLVATLAITGVPGFSGRCLRLRCSPDRALRAVGRRCTGDQRGVVSNALPRPVTRLGHAGLFVCPVATAARLRRVPLVPGAWISRSARRVPSRIRPVPFTPSTGRPQSQVERTESGRGDRALMPAIVEAEQFRNIPFGASRSVEGRYYWLAVVVEFRTHTVASGASSGADSSSSGTVRLKTTRTPVRPHSIARSPFFRFCVPPFHLKGTISPASALAASLGSCGRSSRPASQHMIMPWSGPHQRSFHDRPPTERRTGVEIARWTSVVMALLAPSGGAAGQTDMLRGRQARLLNDDQEEHGKYARRHSRTPHARRSADESVCAPPEKR